MLIHYLITIIGAYVRIDRISPLKRETNKRMFKRNNQKYPTTKITKSKISFAFTFNCSVSVTNCQKVKHGFETAGTLIANSIEIISTINVYISYHSFCDKFYSNHSLCTNRHVLGQATAASFFAAKPINGLPAYYPQSLVKQVEKDMELGIFKTNSRIQPLRYNR
jgi:hypothetical protein